MNSADDEAIKLVPTEGQSPGAVTGSHDNLEEQVHNLEEQLHDATLKDLQHTNHQSKPTADLHGSDDRLDEQLRVSVEALLHFFRWCVTRKLVRNDPTLGIRLKVPKSDGFHTWTEQEIAQFEARWPIGSKPRLALALGLYTAQQPGDVVRIGRQQIKDGVLVVRQQKTGALLAIPVQLRRKRFLGDIPVMVRRRRPAAALRFSRAAQGGADPAGRCRMYRA